VNATPTHGETDESIEGQGHGGTLDNQFWIEAGLSGQVYTMPRGALFNVTLPGAAPGTHLGSLPVAPSGEGLYMVEVEWRHANSTYYAEPVGTVGAVGERGARGARFCRGCPAGVQGLYVSAGLMLPLNTARLTKQVLSGTRRYAVDIPHRVGGVTVTPFGWGVEDRYAVQGEATYRDSRTHP
jgi:hypothetical protein